MSGVWSPSNCREASRVLGMGLCTLAASARRGLEPLFPLTWVVAVGMCHAWVRWVVVRTCGRANAERWAAIGFVTVVSVAGPFRGEEPHDGCSGLHTGRQSPADLSGR